MAMLEDPALQARSLSRASRAYPGSVPGASPSQQLLEGSVRFEDLGRPSGQLLGRACAAAPSRHVRHCAASISCTSAFLSNSALHRSKNAPLVPRMHVMYCRGPKAHQSRHATQDNGCTHQAGKPQAAAAMAAPLQMHSAPACAHRLPWTSSAF